MFNWKLLISAPHLTPDYWYEVLTEESLGLSSRNYLNNLRILARLILRLELYCIFSLTYHTLTGIELEYTSQKHYKINCIR